MHVGLRVSPNFDLDVLAQFEAKKDTRKITKDHGDFYNYTNF